MLQVGICGTFDLQNYGDLLFPLIAEAELSKRLGPITLHRFSYQARTAPGWPYDVTPLSRLPELINELDLLIIGGGHLIRFDKDVAPGYGPSTSELHHPTGYWLTPALIAAQSGCPVAWNAPGVGGDVADWAAPLMRLALESSSYVAVRDEHSRSMLTRFAGEREIAVVPDTAFALVDLFARNEPSQEFSRLFASLGVSGPYLVVHATTGLKPFCDLIRGGAVPELRDHRVVALATGPALGDSATHLRDDLPEVIGIPGWPHPLLAAEIIRRAAAVAGKGLHLSITALTAGVPVFRPEHAFGGKYAFLADYAGVFAFPDDAALDPQWFLKNLAKRPVERGVADATVALRRHWDKIASLATTDRKRSANRQVRGFWQTLPGLLETGIGRELDELRASVVERDARISSLDTELKQRAEALAGLAHELKLERMLVAELRRREVADRAQSVSGESRLRSILRRAVRAPLRPLVNRFRRLREKARVAGDREAMVGSGLFDPEWYLKAYPDVAAAGIDPIDHYLACGAGEGRNPGPLFDARLYVLRNPEAADQNPLLHYIRSGKGSPEDIIGYGPLTLADSSVGRLVGSLSERSAEPDVVVMGTKVSMWHRSTPPI